MAKKKETKQAPQVEKVEKAEAEVVEAPAKSGGNASMRGVIRFVWALLIIVAGIVLLFNNFGVIPWSVWSTLVYTLWRLWPVLVIVWGLQVLFGRSKWVTYLLGFLVALLLVFVAFVSLAKAGVAGLGWVYDYVPKEVVDGGLSYETENKVFEYDYDVEADELSTGSFVMGLDYSEFTLVDSEDEMISIDSTYYPELLTPTLKGEVELTDLTVNFDASHDDKIHGLLPAAQKYDVTFGNGGLLWGMDLQVGAGQGDLKLSSTMLDSLDISVGAGEIDVTLDGTSTVSDVQLEIGAGSLSLTLDGVSPEEIVVAVGAGEFTLVVPENINLIIDYEIGAGVLDVDGKELLGSGKYTVENGGEKVELTVGLGLGSINVVFE